MRETNATDVVRHDSIREVEASNVHARDVRRAAGGVKRYVEAKTPCADVKTSMQIDP